MSTRSRPTSWSSAQLGWESLKEWLTQTRTFYEAFYIIIWKEWVGRVQIYSPGRHQPWPEQAQSQSLVDFVLYTFMWCIIWGVLGLTSFTVLSTTLCPLRKGEKLKPAFSALGYRQLILFLKSIPDYWCSKHRTKLKRDWMDKLRRKKMRMMLVLKAM